MSVVDIEILSWKECLHSFNSSHLMLRKQRDEFRFDSRIGENYSKSYQSHYRELAIASLGKNFILHNTVLARAKARNTFRFHRQRAKREFLAE